MIRSVCSNHPIQTALSLVRFFVCIRYVLLLSHEDKIPVLYLGYQLDKNWNNIIDVSIVCRKGDAIEWFLDLSKLITQNEVHRINIDNDKNTEVEVTVKIKEDSITKRA